MNIRPECLIAFAPTAQLKRQFSHDILWFGGLIQFNGLSQKSKFIQIKGPGLIYIDMKQSKVLFKKDQLSLYFILLYALMSFTMFLIILFDRREPLQTRPGGHEVGAGATGMVEDLAQQLLPTHPTGPDH